MRIKLLYEDDHIIALYKPSGVLSIPDRHDKTLLNIYTWALKKWGEVYTIHRIDKATSGIICLAKTKEALRHYSLQFEHQEVTKIYYAFCKGAPYPLEGENEQPIATHPTIKGKMHIHPLGKASHTLYKTEQQWAGGSYSLVKVAIITGRTHQIRVHLHNLGAPIIGDTLYGDGRGFYLSDIKKNVHLKKGTEERAIIDRLGLHATALRFPQKLGGKENEKLEIEVDLPKDFTASIQQLNKWAGPKL